METSGRVTHVNVSSGGVPKLPVEHAWVSRLGLEGDAHREYSVHGGSSRAVCLFALEAIERLQSEGHPIEPGGAGENLTTTGIEWSLLPVGTRARIGQQLEIELSGSTTPCSTQKGNFLGGRFSRISIDLHPSDSRMYARVLREGEVRAGDPITISPPTADSRAEDELLMARLERAETKSSLATWRAALAGGFDVRIVEDGHLAMAATPQIPGPAFNGASGLTDLPHLVGLATDFFERHGCPGWLGMREPPWPGAEPTLELAIFAADVSAGLSVVLDSLLPPNVTVHSVQAAEAERVELVFERAGAKGPTPSPGVPNAWPAVVAGLAQDPHRHVLLAERAGAPVGTAALHIYGRTGWLRGAAVVPEARGLGVQRALIAERMRLAIDSGCDLVGASAEPRSVSAKNLEHMGFRQVGTRWQFVYQPHSRPA